VIKRLSLVIFFVFTFVSFAAPKNILATCSCKSVNNANVPVADNCVSGKVPVMYIDTTARDGCRCACEKANTPPDRFESNLCADGVSVNTALGCIPVQMDKFIAWLLPYIFSISGGIAFLLMVYGFILMTTSKGDPKAVQGAKETITSAIIGLLISIFAIFILRLIAVDILHIPGMSY
jgi:hypothetical protein